MSEPDNFDAAVKRMGVPPMGHQVIYVRPGLGSKGLYWEARGREHAVPVETWRSLREAALATSHAKFDAADLDGSMVGKAFLALVIRDPQVQAAGAWLCLERPVFRQVFTEGMFPNNVDHAELKKHLGTLPGRTGRDSGYSFAEPASIVRTWDRKWPVVLDAPDLTEIFSAAYDSNANYQHDPTEGPIFHAANALSDRCKAFFDPIRAGQLVASGTSTKTLGAAQISDDQWSRSDKWIDIEGNDLFHKESGTHEVWWSGVKLRLPKARGEKTSPAPPTRILPKSRTRRLIKKPVASAVAECLKEAGFDRDRGDLSYDALANAIAPCMSRRLKKPYNTATDLAALKKAVSRHFSKRRK
jgi:hypothetical protein